MVLIYSHITSQRLQYTCNFIFKELLGIDFSITIDSEEFKNYEGICINYSGNKIKEQEIRIQNVSLLFEEGIQAQNISCFNINDHKAFFKTEGADNPFDIFAASFYLISRYEEYLPHTKDMYGRYAHENSLAFKEGFLEMPLVNIWVQAFALGLKKKFSMFNPQYSTFRFLPTYDIDIAYSYKYKGLIRNVGGFLKSFSLERLKVLLGLQKDPFDSYSWLHQLHQQYKLHPVYFFLVAEKNALYDKNILPHKEVMWQLVKQHSKKYTVGIHPSWQSGDDVALLHAEMELLGEMVQAAKSVPTQSGEMVQAAESVPTRSRQHYIRFNLPEGYRRLIDAGITDDYSMGYGSINGFRASVASSFFWYNLQKEEQTELRIHPFCFMDANAFYEQKLTAAQAYEELMHYYTACKQVNGTLSTIWHNNFLGTDKMFKGWKEVYEKFVEKVSGKL
ncbi:polysaccharide deacetylase family protein [Ferruginibacter sp.]